MPIPQNDGRKTAHDVTPTVTFTEVDGRDALAETEDISQVPETDWPGLKIKIRVGKNGRRSSLQEEANPAINDSATAPAATFPAVKPPRELNRAAAAKPQSKRIKRPKQPMSQDNQPRSQDDADDAILKLPATFPAVKSRIKPVRVSAEQITRAASNLAQAAKSEASRPAPGTNWTQVSETASSRPASEKKPPGKRGRPRKNSARYTSKTFQPAPLNDNDWNRIAANYWRSVREKDEGSEEAEVLAASPEPASKVVDLAVQERKSKANPNRKSARAKGVRPAC
ncbi:hypothetical protein PtA15_5A773 [Puccinia triticina]|nr:uncharacterized protein PtA15_5A773 [Puccinia triticina]WAQ85199.1 hypothetical protein PtA15_5A773 [Puccinia triticina]